MPAGPGFAGGDVLRGRNGRQRLEQRDERRVSLEDDSEGEWLNVCGRGPDPVQAGRGVAREPGRAVERSIRQPDHVRCVRNGGGADDHRSAGSSRDGVDTGLREHLEGTGHVDEPELGTVRIDLGSETHDVEERVRGGARLLFQFEHAV